MFFFQLTRLFWKPEFILSSRSKSRPKITLWLLFWLVMWNGAKMWAVILNFGSLILTSAFYDVEKDQAIVDHLFIEVFLVLNLFVCTNESWMIDKLTPLSIRIFTYLKVLRTSFCKTLIFSELLVYILCLGLNSQKVMGTRSSCVDRRFKIVFFCQSLGDLQGGRLKIDSCNLYWLNNLNLWHYLCAIKIFFYYDYCFK